MDEAEQALFPDDVRVRPGEEHTFEIALKAPDESGCSTAAGSAPLPSPVLLSLLALALRRREWTGPFRVLSD